MPDFREEVRDPAPAVAIEGVLDICLARSLTLRATTPERLSETVHPLSVIKPIRRRSARNVSVCASIGSFAVAANSKLISAAQCITSVVAVKVRHSRPCVYLQFYELPLECDAEHHSDTTCACQLHLCQRS